MYRILPLFLLALTLPAQTPPQTLDKPPQDIDESLRARIKQFYDYHVAKKTRLCEQLISEDAKDDFYAIRKPELESFKIGNIEYSDDFTKAKVVIVGMMPMLMPMVGAKIMEQPFASYWRFENGNWFWYYNKQVAKQNPFGDSSSHAPGTPDSLAAAPETNIAALQSAIKIDRTTIDLASGQTQTVKLTNTLPGPATLWVRCPVMPLANNGITFQLDKNELKANQSATLTLSANSKTRPGSVPLQVVVSPTNQVVDLTVNISR